VNPIVVIPARLAATRLPDKPLADIGGRPMIAHVVERAFASGVGPVAVAVDSPRIAEALEGSGATVIVTSADHPSG
jgi:3-deoxy-manno-octulosonate cytidylyltransferase (CMP-KDO synthetase)